MARTQAPDYEQRREAILDQAAKLYAAGGYLGSSIADLAAACNMSKSLIYHYYGSKEDILFDLIHSQVRLMLRTARAVASQELPPQAKIKELNWQFMRTLFSDEARRHRVVLNEVRHLPPPRRKIIVSVEREAVDVVGSILTELRPKKRLPEAARWPATMFFFGILNWTYTWFDRKGPLTLEETADFASEIFLNGVERAKAPG